MMRCMSSAIAGLKAHQTAMDVVGNDISNVNTYSFKSGSTTFRDTMYQDISTGSGGSTTTAGMNPSQIGYGSAATDVMLDETKGSMNQTGDSHDAYIDGEGYFIIGDSAKDATNDTFTGCKYTRVGTLGFDSNGYLTDGTGNYVMGLQSTDGTTVPALTATTTETGLKALHLPTTSGKVDSIKSFSIASDGTLTCDDNGTSKVVGKIILAGFTNPSGLQQAGNSFYRTTKNAGTENLGAPGASGTGKLTTGALESSNTDLATEFSNMIVFERGYQANTKIISAADEMLQTLVNMK